MTDRPPATAEIPTPQQREAATTIYERSVAGRRAASCRRRAFPSRRWTS